MDLTEELHRVLDLDGDTYSSYEVLGLLGRAEAEIERLRAALKPFADAAASIVEYEQGWPEDEPLWSEGPPITINDFQRAARAHEQSASEAKK